MKKLTAKEILKNIDWKVEIRTSWQGKKIQEDLMLPKYRRDGIKEQIERYIEEGTKATQDIYVGRIGSVDLSIEKLEKEMSIFKKKYSKIMRNPIDKYNKTSIVV